MIFLQLRALLLVVTLSVGIGLIVMGQTFPHTYDYARMPATKGKDVKKLFKQNCVKCHGADGTGETTYGQIVGAADFTDSEWQQRVDDPRVINSITYGRGQMPSFGKKLSKEQIITLLGYVRAFKR